MSIVDKARQLRAVIEGLAVSLDDTAAIESPELFPNWKVGVQYTIGDRVRYEGVLYKVLQAHTSQAEWTPNVAVSLFAKVLNPEGEIPVWEQPTAENAYMTGDKVHYPTSEDSIYESTIDNNVWSPEAYPQGWSLVEG